MTLIIIIILIVTLMVFAILFNAYTQYRERIEAERRAEIAKQRAIVDETENVIMACSQMPISSRMIQILLNRVLSALKVMFEINNGSADTKQHIADVEKRTKAITLEDGSENAEFSLPDTDKLIIQYIQAIKKLRILLRSEHSKGKIDTRTFVEEDKLLERLQLKVNVETLTRRGRAALQTNMLGSARQYFEKAIAALEAQSQLDDFGKNRLALLKQQLLEIQDNLKNANAKDRAKRKEEERDELDELFAPKKKW